MEDVRITASVQRGARWLDENRPGWLDEIDLPTLDLRSPCRCILGQLHGDFANVPGNKEDCPPDFVDNGQTFADWAAEHGFYAFGELAGSGDGPTVVDGYRELTLAWTDLIERRIGEQIAAGVTSDGA